MRFGIETMQFKQLMPPGATAEQILPRLAGFDGVKLVESLAEAGFKLIELSGDLVLFFPQVYAPAQIERLAELKARLGLQFTCHLPLWSVEPSTPLSAVREGSMRALVEGLQAVQALQPEMYVLHATGALAAEFYRMRIPEAARTLVLQRFQQGASATIQSLLAETGLPSRKLALETIEFPLELTLQLAEQHNTSICLDTGHVLAGFAGETPFFDALEKILPRLGEIHLHDCPEYLKTGVLGYGKDHQPLGSGDLDVVRLLRRLNEVGFNGPVIFELEVEQALQSLARIGKEN
ncbi:MAG TPA: cobamide remodeling phosphodiesterase CbiR [Anaerolineaceae bacterium]|nr:cobamide remodeling phosphodiesterase CbiR [Anaerolineaceae bacterium]